MNKKVAISLGVAAVTIAAADIYLLGSTWGIGPLGFIKRNRTANHPGNGEEYSFDKIEPLENSPLKGKNVCVLGSSVFYGAESGGVAIGEYLSARLGFNMMKETVSGTTLSDIGDTSYISRMKKLDTSVPFDLFICQLSTNDATRSLSLGQIGDGDTKKVAGAIEEIIRYVKATWHCPVVFIVGSRYDSFRHERYEAMRELLYMIQEMYEGVGVVDLWKEIKFNDIEKEQRDIYMADGIHPTKAGYRDWWGPEIERQLLQFLNEQDQ